MYIPHAWIHAHNTCRNAEMNLKSTTTNGFNFRIIKSIMESCRVPLTLLDCKLVTILGLGQEFALTGARQTPVGCSQACYSIWSQNEYQIQLVVRAGIQWTKVWLKSFLFMFTGVQVFWFYFGWFVSSSCAQWECLFNYHKKGSYKRYVYC